MSPRVSLTTKVLPSRILMVLLGVGGFSSCFSGAMLVSGGGSVAGSLSDGCRKKPQDHQGEEGQAAADGQFALQGSDEGIHFPTHDAVKLLGIAGDDEFRVRRHLRHGQGGILYRENPGASPRDLKAACSLDAAEGGIVPTSGNLLKEGASILSHMFAPFALATRIVSAGGVITES
jgi:hypothetical protein